MNKLSIKLPSICSKISFCGSIRWELELARDSALNEVADLFWVVFERLVFVGIGAKNQVDVNLNCVCLRLVVGS